jgi:hypothetical protein
MIFYLSKKHHAYTMRWRLLRDWDADLASRQEMLRRFRLLSYEKAFRLRSLPVGTYIFTDLERLSPDETERAAIIWNTLAEQGCRLVNDPVRSMRRFELLRHLREQGINDFDVRRLTDPRPLRFPVFVRSERSHDGSATPLLHSPAELAAVIERLATEGRNRDDKIIVEFRDVADAEGVYHRYGAHIIGAKIFATNLFFGSHWVVKRPDETLKTTPARLAAARLYVETNPHEAMLRRIFGLARIQYGRMDYAVVDGRIQVFEINTNPLAPPAVHLLTGAREIDCERPPTPRIPVTRRVTAEWREELPWTHWVSRGVHRVLRSLNLLGMEARVQRGLSDVRRLFRKK